MGWKSEFTGIKETSEVVCRQVSINYPGGLLIAIIELVKQVIST